MTNASDERALGRKEREDKLAQRQANADFRWLMNEPAGRRVVWGLLGHCRVFASTFNTHGGVMNFNEGQRAVGLHLLGEIDKLCPELYAVMAAENARQRDENQTDD